MQYYIQLHTDIWKTTYLKPRILKASFLLAQLLHN